MEVKIVTAILTILLSTSGGWLLDNLGIIKKYKQTTLNLREDQYQNNLPIFSSYDYVIIGASPSGCVIANRLATNGNHTILVLEAGPETNIFSDVPAFNLYMYDTEYNWKFRSQYNPKVCRSFVKETCPWPSGKGLGGGTIFNAMIYTRGNKRDFDRWAEAGNPGWSYNDLVPYWERAERLRIPKLMSSPGRGKEGPLNIEFVKYRSLGSEVFINAGTELGYDVIDYNTPYGEGFADIQFTMDNGQRLNAATAYLKPLKNKNNLHVTQRAYVTKIIIDPVTMTATGVEFFKKGRKRRVAARKEVILTAGAFGSPKLLQLSGIGRKEYLEPHGIKTLVDLPVGDNLQEHIGSNALVLHINSSDFNLNIPTAFPRLPSFLVEYVKNQTGKLTSPAVESLAYLKTKYSKDGLPDIEMLFVGTALSDDFGYSIRKTVGIRDDVYDAYWKKLHHKQLFSIWVMACYPNSRGTVRLASSNPFDNPVITNNFLDDENDLIVIVEGIKKVLRLIETDAMKKYGARVHKDKMPGCEQFEFGTDEYWGCTVRQVTTQYHHQCGTCRMGPRDDPTSVVDPRLRVKGVRNLRVADMSIAPNIPAGHTMAPAYMIGEKAADLILGDNR